jgi:purine-binding chemotaxis protein CheW
MQSTKQAVFLLGKEEFSFDITEVITIEKGITVEPVTGLPVNFKGMMNLRGDLIPVYSLRSKFGLEDIEQSVDTRYIITDSNGIHTAYEVDKMLEIAEIDVNQINEVPSVLKSKDTSYVKSVTNVQGQLVIMLDSDGILNEEELSKMRTVIKK